MKTQVERVPLETDRYGGKVLEVVVRKSQASNRWRVYARTESYGGRYYIPVAWETSRGRRGQHFGWKRKRDAVAYLETLKGA